MVQKHFETIEGGRLVINIPKELKEVSIGALSNVQHKNYSDLEYVSAFTGISVAELLNIKDVSNLYDQLTPYFHSLLYQLKNSYRAAALPKIINVTVNDTKVISVNVRKAINQLSIFSQIPIREIVVDEIDRHISLYGEDNWEDNYQPTLESCIKVLSYLLYYPVYKKAFDNKSDDIENFSHIVKRLPYTEVGPIAWHIIKTFPNYKVHRVGFLKSIKLAYRDRLIKRHVNKIAEAAKA